MKYLLFRFIIVAFAFYVVAEFVSGIAVESAYTAFILAFFWGVVNTIIRPILVLLTLPVTVATLGLFVLVINALLFWFLSTFVKGFEVSGFFSALLGAILVSLISWGGSMLIKAKK